MIQYITIGASVHRLPLTKQRVKSKFNNYLHSDVSHPFEVDGGRSIDILESEFKKEDVYGATYDFDNDRINKVEVVLADDNAKTYLTAATSFINVTEGEEVLDRKVTISKNPSATGIVTPPVCKVDVKITDKWGKTKTTSIYVEVIK